MPRKAKTTSPPPKPSPSPFKFGFFAGLGFLVAQVVFGTVVTLVALLIFGGTLFSLGHRFNAIPAQAVTPAPALSR